MNRKKFSLTKLLILPGIFVLLAFSEPYAKEGLREKYTDLPQKVEKAEKSMERKCDCPKALTDEERDKQMRAIEGCTSKYEDCIEHCAKTDSDEKCDNACVNDLSECEKNLTKPLKEEK